MFTAEMRSTLWGYHAAGLFVAQATLGRNEHSAPPEAVTVAGRDVIRALDSDVLLELVHVALVAAIAKLTDRVSASSAAVWKRACLPGWCIEALNPNEAARRS